MHECPECGQACDCDGEDTWNSGLQIYLNCTHDCQEFDDDSDNDDFDYEDFVVNFKAGVQRDAAEHYVEQSSADAPLSKADTSDAGEFPVEDMSEKVYSCGNCGVPRYVESGILERCPNFHDDEIDLSLVFRP